ncbi:MAG: SDR family oxidoreductase [Deltaproteobacteria bacterium]|nr:MAG: SDR family oxidoreductase [Deltaproteobacteria bacterium]
MERGAQAVTVALVTGAGSGIGRATARHLAGRGCRLALVGRTARTLEETAASLEGALVLPADVRDAEAVAQAVAQTEEALGPIDLLVNNAGVVARAAVHEMDEATWDEVLDINLKGAFLCARAVLPAMLARGRGRIVNVASISGTLGTPLLSAYCASKWGLIGFTKALSEEVKGRGVVVAAVSPGSVDTPMLRRGVPGLEPDMTPDDVASVITYLGLDAPPAIAGASLEIFG